MVGHVGARSERNEVAEAGSTEPGIHAFNVLFESVTCDMCNSTGVVTRPCGCGEWVPRPDEHVGRRRLLVAPLRELLEAEVRPTEPIDMGSALRVAGEFVEDLFAGVRALAGDGPESGPMEQAIRGLLDLRARAAAEPRKRPWLAMWDPYAAMLASLVDLARFELDVLEAPDPDDATSLQARAQTAIDEASRLVNIVSNRLSWWDAPSTVRLPDNLIEAADEAYSESQAADILDLDRWGLAHYQRITGKSAAPHGIGVGLLLFIGRADRALDEDRLYRIARRVYEALDPRRGRLSELLDDPEWRGLYLEAARTFYEARLSAEVELDALAGHRRMEVKAVLRVGAELTERVSRNLLGLLLAVRSSGTARRPGDYSTVLQQSSGAGWDDLTLGFDRAIRDAHAHVDYEVGEDFVVLGPGKPRPTRLPDDHLVDTVLSAVESSSAILAGIDVVLAELEHPAGLDHFMELPVEARVSAVIAAAGMRPERVVRKGARLEASGTAQPFAVVRPLSVVALIASSVTADITEVRLRLRRADAHLRVVAPLAPLRRFLASDGVEKEAAVVEFLAKARINGSPVFSQRHSRFMTAVFASRAMESSGSPVPAIETLVVLAERLGDRELLEAVRAFLVAARAREGGRPITSAESAAIRRLAAYVSPPGPWWDGSPRPPSGLAAA